MNYDNFEVSYKEVDGRKIPIVKIRECNIEKIKNVDGTERVIIHVPTLSLLEKMGEEQ